MRNLVISVLSHTRPFLRWRPFKLSPYHIRVKSLWFCIPRNLLLCVLKNKKRWITCMNSRFEIPPYVLNLKIIRFAGNCSIISLLFFWETLVWCIPIILHLLVLCLTGPRFRGSSSSPAELRQGLCARRAWITRVLAFCHIPAPHPNLPLKGTEGFRAVSQFSVSTNSLAHCNYIIVKKKSYIWNS